MRNETTLTLSIEEAAVALGIGRNLCYELAAQGKIPVLRLGVKRLLVPRAALEKLLAEGRSPAKRG